MCKANKRCPCPDIKNNGDAFPGPRHHTTSWHNINGPIETRLYALVLLLSNIEFLFTPLPASNKDHRLFNSCAMLPFVFYTTSTGIFLKGFRASTSSIKIKKDDLPVLLCIQWQVVIGGVAACRKMEVMKYTPKKYHTQLNEPSDTFFPGRRRIRRVVVVLYAKNNYCCGENE